MYMFVGEVAGDTQEGAAKNWRKQKEKGLTTHETGQGRTQLDWAGRCEEERLWWWLLTWATEDNQEGRCPLGFISDILRHGTRELKV